MTEVRYSGGVRAGKTRLLWVVVGHEDNAGSECRVCGTKFGEWREKIERQHGALQEDCCKGIVISAPSAEPGCHPANKTRSAVQAPGSVSIDMAHKPCGQALCTKCNDDGAGA